MADKILVDTTKPKEVPEVMHKMSDLCLIRRIAALGMREPLLLRGLREKERGDQAPIDGCHQQHEQAG